MKNNFKKLLVLPVLLLSFYSNAVNVTIIESQSGNSWAVQDNIWKNVATGMGYNAIVVPQSTLDSITNLDTTDVLLVSSGTILFGATNHLQTIRQFILSGRSAYIQSEYTGNYQGTITFDSLMQTVGANFNWIGTISGSLVPMNVLGTFATTPNNTTTLNYFNYGYAGTGTGVEKFLEYMGNYFGFCYSDSNNINGTIITVSDEDWAWNNASPDLMENILYRLVHSPTSINDVDNEFTFTISPNPFTDKINITIADNNPSAIILYDISGRKLHEQSFTNSVTINTSQLAKGIYLYELLNKNEVIKKGKVVNNN